MVCEMFNLHRHNHQFIDFQVYPICGKKVAWWKLWQKWNMTWRPMIKLKLTRGHFLSFCHSYCIGLRHLLCWGMWCWYTGWLVVVVGPSAPFWPSTTLSRISRGVPGPQLSRDCRSHLFLCAWISAGRQCCHHRHDQPKFMQRKVLGLIWWWISCSVRAA